MHNSETSKITCLIFFEIWAKVLTSIIKEKTKKRALNIQNNTPTIQATKAIAEFILSFSGKTSQLESFNKRCDTFHTNYGNPHQ